MKNFVINLFGGPGSSKSTTASGIFSLLKLHGVNAELVSEFAKDLTWEGRFVTLKNQNYITAKQHHRQWRLKDVDVIITDSPLLLGVVYSDDNEPFKEHIHNLYKEYNNVNYFLKRYKEYNPKGRSQTLEQAIELDYKIKDVLYDYNHDSVNGDFDAINYITKETLKSLGIQNIYSINKD